MTKIIDWAVGNTRVVLGLLAVVVIAGISAFIAIPKEAQPDIPIPVIMVEVPYPGISPEDSERLLVKPMETYLRSVQGLKEITARAYEGFAVIILEFDVSFDKEKALEDVRAQVETARGELPTDSKQPIVQEFNTSLFPVISVALSGDVPERTLLQMSRTLRDSLKQIPTVLDVDIGGERLEQLEINIDPAKLESYGITQTEMFNAITANNRLIAAGSIDTGHGNFAVKVPGVLETAQDVLTLPIRSTPDATVTLQDVASVHRDFYDPTSYAMVDGKRTITLDVTKRIGANIIETNQAVKALIDKAAKSWPKNVKVTYLFDESTDIHDQLGSLSDSIFLAIVLVMIIIVAALGLRAGLLVGVAIPTSFLMAFMIINGIGMALNEMIMFAMLLAVGILVDGAIIVVEYADRKMAEGHTPKLAFAEAARRMFWPVVSATLTMIGAFLPMLLWPGVSGKFMSYFPITLIVVLFSSMVVALIFLPVLGGIFKKPPPRDLAQERAVEASESGDWHDIPGITGWYAHMAERLTRHPGRVIMTALATVVVVIGLFVGFNKGVTFFVDTDPDFFSVLISARGNLSADDKRNIVMDVYRRIADVDGIRSIYASSGAANNSLNSQGGTPVDNIGHISIELKPYTERRKGMDIMREIQQRTANIPGVHTEVRLPQQGPPTGKDVMIDVSSDDYVALANTTAALRKHMDAQPELRDVEDTRPLPGIEWDLQIDRPVASRFGANVQSIGTAMQLVTDGIFVGTYRPDDSDQQVDIRVRYPSASRGIHALDDVRVPTANGMVPASNFVKLVPAQQVNSIERVNGHRVYHVRANMKAQCSATITSECVAKPILPSAEVEKLKSWIATQNFPASVHIAFRGGQEQQDESLAFLKVAGLMALFLIGIVLLALFNSFYHTALILIAVILAMIGALFGMVAMQQPFSVIMTGTGMLALAGIVVNHNIVLIDTFHRLRDSGMDPIEAVVRSSAQRLRPVFLTTVTAIGGLLPMMLAIEIDFWSRTVTIGSPNAMMWVQLSTAIVFGLAFSKLITLGLVPAMLALPYRMRERWAVRNARLSQTVVAGVIRPSPVRPFDQAAE
ncbi:MAG TPA: efflux RND transporter permease subunit [Rhizomicrobium sp.]|nr:efflux RND transporter permease subunit [Rhizomicrobium sp.]